MVGMAGWTSGKAGCEEGFVNKRKVRRYVTEISDYRYRRCLDRRRYVVYGPRGRDETF